MMSALISQELRTSRRMLLGTLGTIVLVAAFSFILAALRVPLIGSAGLVVGILASLLLVPAALAVLAIRYWQSMYGREGYFTMSIPVRGRGLFWAKTLYALLVAVVAAAISALGLATAMVVLGISQGLSTTAALESLRGTLDSLGAPMLWFLAVVLLVQLVFAVLCGAAIMSIGAEGRFNRLGFGAPLLGWVGLYVFMQAAGLAAMLFVPLGLTIGGPDAGTLVAQGMLQEFIDALRNPGAGGQQQVDVLGLGVIPLTIAVTALLAWWGVRSIERRTSLR
ncbi:MULTISPECIES: hypothetical protein [unclassified Leucobacter]|uniref:hypothetical protein n=1 Tax=unclassified Leucobacter TaxID=2621730 RepID=UPI00117AE9AC|nr:MULTISPECIES: hypothetical protein [unclassified Leucobacter]